MKKLVLSTMIASACLFMVNSSAFSACPCKINSQQQFRACPACPVENGCCEACPMTVLESQPQFSMFVSYLKKTGLDLIIRNKGPFTIFAPTNLAFERSGICGIKDINKVKKILMYHIVPCDVEISTIRELDEIGTLEGDRLSFTECQGWTYVDNARILETDICERFGMIHSIEDVIFPEEA